MSYAFDRSKPIISVEQERQFTEVRLNLLHETGYVLKKANLLDELSAETMRVLNGGLSMRALRELSPGEAARLESDWNVVFTGLALRQGELKSLRKALAEHNILSYGVAAMFRRPFAA